MIGSLFSGIGGLELGLEACGLGPVAWQCERDPAARAVLAQWWPGVPCYDDVRRVDATAQPVDLICGGFPCQPVSSGGHRKAQRDTRWLWPHFAAVVAHLRPRIVFIENVGDLRARGLRDVLADLASLGFDAEWDTFRADEAGAPHRRRNRLFVLAYANGHRRKAGPGCAGKVDTGQAVPAQQVGHDLESSDWWVSEPAVGRVVDGFPRPMDRIRLLGNACIPAQAALAYRTLSARVPS